MIIKDDRTEEQKATHHCLVVGTDRFLSGWGMAAGGASYAAWACKPESRLDCLCWVEHRGDMKRIREVVDDGGKNRYRPGRAGHLHIYVWKSSQEVTQ